MRPVVPGTFEIKDDLGLRHERWTLVLVRRLTTAIARRAV